MGGIARSESLAKKNVFLAAAGAGTLLVGGALVELTIDFIKLGSHELALWLHTEVDPPQDEWERALAEYGTVFGRRGGEDFRSLVVSDGGAPNLTQRSQFHDVHEGTAVKSSVITPALSNPLKRGVATALRWMNPRFAFYSPEQADRALQHLDLAGELAAVWGVLLKMERRLRPNRAMRMMAQTFALSR